MSGKLAELFGIATYFSTTNWPEVAERQNCPYLDRKCLKIRKSQPQISIGTSIVIYGSKDLPVVICPYRLLERKQLFTDCLHLLTLHEPGNELHMVGEVSVPGGNIDYVLVSARARRAIDFVGIELQTLDTTGTLWPERQCFLKRHGVPVLEEDVESRKSFGMNWKMTAKTALVQLHHKIETFESLNKHLVLAIQDRFLDYMRAEFSFSHLNAARVGDPMQIHAYTIESAPEGYRLQLKERLSTDATGIARCLGLSSVPRVELEQILRTLESKISDRTLMTL